MRWWWRQENYDEETKKNYGEEAEKNYKEKAQKNYKEKAAHQRRKSLFKEQRRLRQIAQVLERERKGCVRQLPERLHQLGRHEVQKSHDRHAGV